MAGNESNGKEWLRQVVMREIDTLTCEDKTRMSRNEAHLAKMKDDFRKRLEDKPNEHPIQNPLRILKDGRIIAGGYRYLVDVALWMETKAEILRRVPCLVLSDELDDLGRLIEQAKDNEFQLRYTPIERAMNILHVMELRGCSQAEAGLLLGIKPPQTAQLLSLFKNIPQDLWDKIGDGREKVVPKTAYHIGRVKDEAKIRSLMEQASKGLLTAEAAEEVSARFIHGQPKRAKPRRVKDGSGTIEFPGDWSLDRFIEWLTSAIEAARKAIKHELGIESLQKLWKPK